jgi:hypothetical protein
VASLLPDLLHRRRPRGLACGFVRRPNVPAESTTLRRGGPLAAEGAEVEGRDSGARERVLAGLPARAGFALRIFDATARTLKISTQSCPLPVRQMPVRRPGSERRDRSPDGGDRRWDVNGGVRHRQTRSRAMPLGLPTAMQSAPCRGDKSQAGSQAPASPTEVIRRLVREGALCPALRLGARARVVGIHITATARPSSAAGRPSAYALICREARGVTPARQASSPANEYSRRPGLTVISCSHGRVSVPGTPSATRRRWRTRRPADTNDAHHNFQLGHTRLGRDRGIEAGRPAAAGSIWCPPARPDHPAGSSAPPPRATSFIRRASVRPIPPTSPAG